MELTPKSEINNRIKRLQEKLVAEELDGVFILQNADLFYFTGTVQSSILYVPAEGTPILMGRKNHNRITKESSIETIISLTSFKEIPHVLKDQGIKNLSKIGLELDVLPSVLYLNFQKLFPGTSLGDASRLIRLIRMIKSDYEVDILREAGRVTDIVMDKAREVLKEGLTEYEFATMILNFALQHGHQGVVRLRGWNQELPFLPLVLSGENGAIPSFMDAALGGKGINYSIPIGPGHKKICPGEPIMIDFGIALNGYVIDQTRTMAIGRLSADLVAAHKASLDIQEETVKYLLPGKSCSEIYKVAIETAKKLGYEDHLMGYGENRARFVGHGVGIEMDELPVLANGFKILLEKNMTIAVELKLILPKIGSVGIENTWLIRKEEPECLTRSSNSLYFI